MEIGACAHRGGIIGEEWSGFTGRFEPVFRCDVHSSCVLLRINDKPYQRCLGCKDTKRPAEGQPAPGLMAEASAVEGEFSCIHRKEVAYTVEAGSRPCVRRSITVWNCEKHGECSLRFESCLNGKVKGCSTCSDLTSLVQINANQGAD
jgi:hypothetical protein